MPMAMKQESVSGSAMSRLSRLRQHRENIRRCAEELGIDLASGATSGPRAPAVTAVERAVGASKDLGIDFKIVAPGRSIGLGVDEEARRQRWLLHGDATLSGDLETPALTATRVESHMPTSSTSQPAQPRSLSMTLETASGPGEMPVQAGVLLRSHVPPQHSKAISEDLKMNDVLEAFKGLLNSDMRPPATVVSDQRMEFHGSVGWPSDRSGREEVVLMSPPSALVGDHNPSAPQSDGDAGAVAISPSQEDGATLDLEFGSILRRWQERYTDFQRLTKVIDKSSDSQRTQTERLSMEPKTNKSCGLADCEALLKQLTQDLTLHPHVEAPKAPLPSHDFPVVSMKSSAAEVARCVEAEAKKVSFAAVMEGNVAAKVRDLEAEVKRLASELCAGALDSKATEKVQSFQTSQNSIDDVSLCKSFKFGLPPSKPVDAVVSDSTSVADVEPIESSEGTIDIVLGAQEYLLAADHNLIPREARPTAMAPPVEERTQTSGASVAKAYPRNASTKETTSTTADAAVQATFFEESDMEETDAAVTFMTQPDAKIEEQQPVEIVAAPLPLPTDAGPKFDPNECRHKTSYDPAASELSQSNANTPEPILDTCKVAVEMGLARDTVASLEQVQTICWLAAEKTPASLVELKRECMPVVQPPLNSSRPKGESSSTMPAPQSSRRGAGPLPPKLSCEADRSCTDSSMGSRLLQTEAGWQGSRPREGGYPFSCSCCVGRTCGIHNTSLASSPGTNSTNALALAASASHPAEDFVPSQRPCLTRNFQASPNASLPSALVAPDGLVDNLPAAPRAPQPRSVVSNAWSSLQDAFVPSEVFSNRRATVGSLEPHKATRGVGYRCSEAIGHREGLGTFSTGVYDDEQARLLKAWEIYRQQQLDTFGSVRCG